MIGEAVRDLLRARGVKTWGWNIVDGVILFRTRQVQAQYAQYWLDRHAVPYSGGISKRRPQRRRRPRRSRQGSGGIFDTLARWLE